MADFFCFRCKTTKDVKHRRQTPSGSAICASCVARFESRQYLAVRNAKAKGLRRKPKAPAERVLEYMSENG